LGRERVRICGLEGGVGWPDLELTRQISKRHLTALTKDLPMKTTTSVLAILSCLLFDSSAWAHAHLRAEDPAADGTLKTAPTALSLTFSEGLEIKLSGVTLKGSDGNAVSTGAPSLSAGDDKLMTVPITGQLGSGVYTVEWHALSKDGHTTHGTYRFTVDH
jgi:copper resistance protein C